MHLHPNFIHCTNGIRFCWLLSKSTNSHIDAVFQLRSLIFCGNSPTEHAIIWRMVLGAGKYSPVLSCIPAWYCARDKGSIGHHCLHRIQVKRERSIVGGWGGWLFFFCFHLNLPDLCLFFCPKEVLLPFGVPREFQDFIWDGILCWDHHLNFQMAIFI